MIRNFVTLTSRNPYLTHSRLKCSEQKSKHFHLAPMARMTSLANLVRFFIDPQGRMHRGHHIYVFISWTTCSLELHHNTAACVEPFRIMFLWSAHKHNLLSLLSFVTEVNFLENLTSFLFAAMIDCIATWRKRCVSSPTTQQDKAKWWQWALS